MIMLATTTTKRVHCQERSSIIYPRPVILRITDHLIGACDISQCLKIRHHSRRIGVKCYIFAMLSPERISGHTEHKLIRSHLLNKTAGLRALSRINISQTGIFISSEHTSRHLAEYTAN